MQARPPQACFRDPGAMAITQDGNLRWWLDFVTDTLVSGRHFRILSSGTSFTGLHLAGELYRIAELRG